MFPYHAANPTSRIRKWSFSRSKDKKAQDNHFVRTNSGRWIKTEHPLISTDDEDDEARRRRDRERHERDAAPPDDHDQTNDLPFDDPPPPVPTPDHPVIPPWHATRNHVQWDNYDSSPSNNYYEATTPSSDSEPPAGNVHNPPAPIPFPTPNFRPGTPTREERRGKIRYKPGSLYPMHNPMRPAHPYINWHLRPPDLDLPPIFAPAHGTGAAKGASSFPEHAAESPSKEPATREPSRDGRAGHQPNVQPPTNLAQATSAILGHATSHRDLREFADQPPASRSGSESGHQQQTNTTPPQGPSQHQPPISAAGADPNTTLDLADAWGASWSVQSPYDLGKTPLTGLKIPTAPPPMEAFTPKKRRLSPLGGTRSRRPSQEPSSGRPSHDLVRSRSMEPQSSRPATPERLLERKTSHAAGEDGGKKGGLRALFTGSASHLPSLDAEHFIPRVRKRTISLGQTGIGIPIPTLGGPPRSRKPSFEVTRRPSIRPDGDDRDKDREDGSASPTKIITDSEMVSSPMEETAPQPSSSRQYDENGYLSARPSLDVTPQRHSSESRRTRSSRDLAREPSINRSLISGPMPLKKTPSQSSMSRGQANVLTAKKSTSHLGHGDYGGIGLGRKPSYTNTPPTIQPTPTRGRKTSSSKPPRTLHRYAQSIEQFEALYHPRQRTNSNSSQNKDPNQSGGVLNKLAKKLSWVTKSAKEREHEAEVEERAREYERERALERRLEDARAKGDADDQDLPRRSVALHDPGFLPLAFPVAGDTTSLNVQDMLARGMMASQEVTFPPSFGSAMENLTIPRPSMDDARSPSNGGKDYKRRSLAKSPSAKLAALMMSPRSNMGHTPQQQSLSLFSPIANAASLLSPKRQTSGSRLAGMLMPLSTETPPPPAGGDLPSPEHDSETFPRRTESPVSMPRMTLTIMNPDAPSPPTPVTDLFPDNDKEKHRPPTMTPRPRPRGHERSASLKVENKPLPVDSATDSSETDDQRRPFIPPGVMSPAASTTYPFPQADAYMSPYVSSHIIHSPEQLMSPALSQLMMSPGSNYHNGLIGYVTAPAAATESRPASEVPPTASYTQHTGVMMQNGIMNTVTVIMPHHGTPAAAPNHYTSPHAVERPVDSSTDDDAMPMKTGSVHAVLSYEPAAPPIRPAMLNQTASDPIAVKPTTSPSRPAPKRGETISAHGKQFEVIIDENGQERSSKRLSKRRTSMKPETVITEEVRGMAEADRALVAERERDREKARQHWERERQRDDERQRERERHQRRESERRRQERDSERALEHRTSYKPQRASTVSTKPPTPPPKGDVHRPKPSAQASSSSGSSATQATPTRVLSKQSRRSHTADSVAQAVSSSPTKQAKLRKSPSNRPAPLPAIGANPVPRHHLDDKPLPIPRPTSEVSVVPDVKRRESRRDRSTKGASMSMSMDRAEMVEHIIGKPMPMPTLPKILDDPTLDERSPAQQRAYLAAMSTPQSSATRSSILPPPGHGSAFTSFSVSQSPYNIHAPLGYGRESNPLPRPPRDISLELES